MKILVPVDGSRHSTSAVAFIALRASLIRAQPEVELLNVQMKVPPHAAKYAGRALVQSYYRDEAERVLRPARNKLQKAGLRVKARYVVGSVAITVARMAAASAADLIAMGSHGRTALKGLLFGSVTQAVLASCKTPLLLIRAGPPSRAQSLKVGIAVDGSAYGTATVRFALKHRELWGDAPQFSLIHVMPKPIATAITPLGEAPSPLQTPQQAQDLWTETFDRIMAPLRTLVERSGLRANEVRLIHDNPGDAIASETGKRRLDVLVIGSHGYGAFKAAVLGSVATRVAAQCRTPLLLVRRGGRPRRPRR